MRYSIYFLLLIGLSNTDCSVTQNIEGDLSIFKKSISVVCATPLYAPIKIDHTLGTGINFIYKDWIWFLTCRHVIEPELNKSKVQFFFRIQYKDSSSLNSALFTFKDSTNLRFHPDDIDDKTRDIALYYFGHILETPEKYNFLELPLEANIPPLNDGDDLLILGYPKNNLSYDVIYNNERELPLRILRAKFLSDISDAKTINYNKTAIEQNHAVIDMVEDLSGMSGGLVLVRHGTDYVPVGMVTGGGIGRIIDLKDSDTTKINFISFVHLKYLYDILRYAK